MNEAVFSYGDRLTALRELEVDLGLAEAGGEGSLELEVPVSGRTLKISSRERWDVGSGATLWDSAVALVAYLDHETSEAKARIRGSTVVELGAGSGLAGMAFAALGARSVTLTDLPLVIPHLSENVAANGFPSDQCRCVAYSFGEDAARLSPPFDFVVGADTVYSVDMIDPFVASLVALAGPRSTVVIATEQRERHIHLAFKRALAERFRVHRVAPRRLQAALGREAAGHSGRLEILLCRQRKPGMLASLLGGALWRRPRSGL